MFLQCGSDKVAKQWVGIEGVGFEFWVILHGDEPGVVWDFDDFDEIPVRAGSGRVHAGFDQAFFVRWIEFESVAMSFRDFLRAVRLTRFRFFCKDARLRSEPHRAAFVGDRLLFFE